MLGKVKDKLRKAGASLREFDDAYATKVSWESHATNLRAKTVVELTKAAARA